MSVHVNVGGMLVNVLQVWCSVVCVFKQKTAYEMRISDWSSDVCSSDLMLCSGAAMPGLPRQHLDEDILKGRLDGADALNREPCVPQDFARFGHRGIRSEEHTSELQSLMRISYAVFCLKKKKQK